MSEFVQVVFVVSVEDDVLSLDDVLDELEHIMNIMEETESQKTQTRQISMSDNEMLVFGILDDEPKSIDEISQKTNLSTQKTLEMLLKLELKNAVKTLPGENFVKT